MPCSKASLLPTLALVFFPACSGTEAEASGAGGGSSSAPSSAAIAEADSSELVTLQRELLQGVGTTLKDVQDEASAQDALPELKGLADSADAMGARLQELMQGDMEASDRIDLATELMGMLQDGKGMMSELERLDGVPGVREVLEPEIDRIMRMFETR